MFFFFFSDDNGAVSRLSLLSFLFIVCVISLCLSLPAKNGNGIYVCVCMCIRRTMPTSVMLRFADVSLILSTVFFFSSLFFFVGFHFGRCMYATPLSNNNNNNKV
jgi:hypothetical protein